MRKKYVVKLSDTERKRLQEIVTKGQHPAYKIKHAHILLKANVNGTAWADVQIAKAFECHPQTVRNLRKRFCESGLCGAVQRRKFSNPLRQPRLDGASEARLIALCCGDPPEGFGRWTLRLLADKLVELEIVESISHETVRRTLKKNALKPHLRQQWVIPPSGDAEFVSGMERVLDVYQRPLDGRYPVVNMDEQSVQLLANKYPDKGVAPGHIMRVDYEYIRKGSGSVFLFTEALRGWRKVSVRERRTAVDWAEAVKNLLAEDYPEADQVILICDNLNTHKLSSLYKAFDEGEASRLSNRLELCHTPKPGSWLNIAEIELSVLTRQCVSHRRLSDVETLRSEVEAWASHRNGVSKGVDWQFTTKDARIRLKRLYPQFET